MHYNQNYTPQPLYQQQPNYQQQFIQQSALYMPPQLPPHMQQIPPQYQQLHQQKASYPLFNDEDTSEYVPPHKKN
jgi:hypothetical protein